MGQVFALQCENLSSDVLYWCKARRGNSACNTGTPMAAREVEAGEFQYTHWPANRVYAVVPNKRPHFKQGGDNDQHPKLSSNLCTGTTSWVNPDPPAPIHIVKAHLGLELLFSGKMLALQV